MKKLHVIPAEAINVKLIRQDVFNFALDMSSVMDLKEAENGPKEHHFVGALQEIQTQMKAHRGSNSEWRCVVQFSCDLSQAGAYRQLRHDRLQQSKRPIKKEIPQMKNLEFSSLTDANRRRLPLFKNAQGAIAHDDPAGRDWSVAEWTNALAGEAGEACNIAKKLLRGDYGANFQEGRDLLLKELADVVIYADLCAQRINADLGSAVIAKFNEVSERVGVDIKL